MPSVILGQPFLSGAQQIVLGSFWSGRQGPSTGVQLILDQRASGRAYIGLSGGMTCQSGGMFLSGGGILDGVCISPGVAYFIPKSAFQWSGTPSVYAWVDLAGSGQARLFWEAY
jgi:hypothetical protein